MRNRKPKVIQFGNHSVSAPTLFASYRLGDYPNSGLKFFPWDITGTEALLINAYDLKRPKYSLMVKDGWSSATHLSFPDKPILVDSGAYYFRKKNKIDITPEEILDVQLRSLADVGVVLDHPFPPNASDKAIRIDNTIKNTERALKVLAGSNANMSLMPAVHGHTPQAVRGCIQRVGRLIRTYCKTDSIPRVGIGSLAPLAQNGNVKLAADVIMTTRRSLPSSHIHCFSMGSALAMLLAFYCGADTVDSQSWILTAGFKYAQLPGHPVMRLANRDYKSPNDFARAKSLFAERIQELHSSEEFYVRNWQSGERIDMNSSSEVGRYVESLSDVVSNENLHNRACHNLWAYNFEVKQVRKAILEDRFEEFVESRLSGTRYANAFEHARAKMQKW